VVSELVTHEETMTISVALVIMVSKCATQKKTKMMNSICCLGFKACNTPKKPVLVVLVLQVAQKKP
jgi:hypothetical protein